MVDTETLIVSRSQYQRSVDAICEAFKSRSDIGRHMAFTSMAMLASQCWDAQKYYANECERLREELRQLRLPSPTDQGEKK